MKFTAAQCKILDEHSRAYKDAQGNDAKLQIVSDAAHAIIDAHEASKTTKALPKNLHQVSSTLLM